MGAIGIIDSGRRLPSAARKGGGRFARTICEYVFKGGGDGDVKDNRRLYGFIALVAVCGNGGGQEKGGWP